VALIEELLAANARYADAFAHGGLPVPPARRLAVVACMDARLDVHAIFGLAPGEAHVIRNAGGVVSEDVLRSLVISQRLLGTRTIVLLHHTDCGMLTFKDDELRRRIEEEVGVRPSFAFDAFDDLERDLRQSVRRIALCPFLPHRDDVHGLVFDVRTGRVTKVV
jgi:carbonic anhydrase